MNIERFSHINPENRPSSKLPIISFSKMPNGIYKLDMSEKYQLIDNSPSFYRFNNPDRVIEAHQKLSERLTKKFPDQFFPFIRQHHNFFQVEELYAIDNIDLEKINEIVSLQERFCHQASKVAKEFGEDIMQINYLGNGTLANVYLKPKIPSSKPRLEIGLYQDSNGKVRANSISRADQALALFSIYAKYNNQIAR